MVSHRGLEAFKVAFMGIKNSVQHVQRELDAILQSLALSTRYTNKVEEKDDTLQKQQRHIDIVYKQIQELRVEY